MRQEMISALGGCIFGFRHTTSNFPCRLALLHPLRGGDFVIAIPAVARCSRDAGIDALSTYILRTSSIFKCDSSNCGLWGCGVGGKRPRAANVILIRLPQEGDRRRHAVVCLRILSAPLLFFSAEPCICHCDRKCPLFGASAA